MEKLNKTSETSQDISVLDKFSIRLHNSRCYH